MTLEDLKKAVGNKNLILGSQRTVKELKKGSLKKIFLASNCDKATKETIEINAKVLKVDVSKLNITSEELGIIVKKPFSVSVASLLK
jgi:large subunit ribosomal protein L30e